MELSLGTMGRYQKLGIVLTCSEKAANDEEVSEIDVKEQVKWQQGLGIQRVQDWNQQLPTTS